MVSGDWRGHNDEALREPVFTTCWPAGNQRDLFGGSRIKECHVGDVLGCIGTFTRHIGDVGNRVGICAGVAGQRDVVTEAKLVELGEQTPIPGHVRTQHDVGATSWVSGVLVVADRVTRHFPLGFVGGRVEVPADRNDCSIECNGWDVEASWRGVVGWCDCRVLLQHGTGWCERGHRGHGGGDLAHTNRHHLQDEVHHEYRTDHHGKVAGGTPTEQRAPLCGALRELYECIESPAPQLFELRWLRHVSASVPRHMLGWQ